MQHNQAVEDHLVEQYLLNEMPSPLRDEFEEHFFECQECAAELRSTAAFMDAAREELAKPQLSKLSVVKESDTKKWWLHLWSPGFAFAALAACLLVLVYQNTIQYPKLTKEVATLEAPEVVATLSLVGAGSRSGGFPSPDFPASQSFLLQVDIPAQPQFSSYTCQLLSPAHKVLWTVQVLPQQARDTVSIRVPAADRPSGMYSFVVQGNGVNSASGVELTRYSFLLNSGPTGSSH